ncbi:hypothetical protein DFQ27_001455 [Actinomortierella ambigua]|uniref:Protein-serine/threonine kinase n=1 Tax=Actinomortierella ambigua TaxID=1343610 RepID=A0A9P6UCV9_9FUNG|nr:hypothetical protein DFQ27_001455 [Actinomortierella ambigua]
MMSTATLPFRGMHQQSEAGELDDVVSFYDDKVAQYATQGIQTVTLKKLLGFSRQKSGATTTPSTTTTTTTASDGSGPVRQKQQQQDLEANLEMARFARAELPVRLARRVAAMQKLPFIVGTNPYIKQVYKLYYDSFQTITGIENDIRNAEDLDEFAGILHGLVASHADVIPMLSQGFLECQTYMPKADIRVFLDEMIRARIGIRLIAEQVISLREQREEDDASGGRSRGYVGVVNTALQPAELVRTCANFVQELCDVNYGSSPEVVINGQTDTTFTYVPVHLEYILCELLKNSLRATVEQSAKIGRRGQVIAFGHGSGGVLGDEATAATSGGDQRRHATSSRPPSSSSSSSSSSIVTVLTDDALDETQQPNEYGHPPVEVTIAQSEHEVTIRIRDQGGGISREHFDKVFEYSFTTVKNENEQDADGDLHETPYGVDNIFKGVSRLAMQAGLGGPIAGLGFGLPLARIYAQYFGGSMHLISLDGHGCDIFLKLKQIDETLDDLQI